MLKQGQLAIDPITLKFIQLVGKSSFFSLKLEKCVVFKGVQMIMVLLSMDLAYLLREHLKMVLQLYVNK